MQADSRAASSWEPRSLVSGDEPRSLVLGDGPTMPSDRVYKLRVSGAIEDLHAKLGQERYSDFQSDVSLAGEICKFIKDRQGHLRTPEFQQLLELLLDDLTTAMNESITPIQHALKKIVDLQNFGTARPPFANEAYVFVTKDIADDMPETVKNEQSFEYIIYVSPEYKGYIDAALAQNTWSHIRNRMRGSKQPKIRQPEEQLDLCPMAPSFAAWCKQFYVQSRVLKVRPDDVKSRSVHSTGSLPNDEDERQKAWGRAAYKSFKLTQKPAMAARVGQADEDADGEQLDDAANEDNVSDNGDDDARAPDSDADNGEDAHSTTFSQGLDNMSDLDGTNDRLDALVDSLLLEFDQDQHVKPLPKNGTRFASYVSDKLLQLAEHIIMPLIHASDVEKEIELVLKDVPHNAAKVTKVAFKKLFNLASRCFKRDVLMTLLAPAQAHGSQSNKSQDGLKRAVTESLELATPRLEKELKEQIKGIQKEEWNTIKNTILPNLLKNGPAHVAYFLCGTLLDISNKVFEISEDNVRDIAKQAWKSQEEHHREHEKAEAKKKPRPKAERLQLVDTSDTPAWFASEARRHLDAGADAGRYEYAVL